MSNEVVYQRRINSEIDVKIRVEETCEMSDLKVASIEMKNESVQSSNSSNEIPDLELDMLEMETVLK